MLSEKHRNIATAWFKTYNTYELSVTPMENSTSKEYDGANHYTFTKLFLQPAYLADWNYTPSNK
jgi:hypothetical protein